MQIFACIGLTLAFLLNAEPVSALWCGDDLIMEDQSALEVQEILENELCGELLAAETIGSIRTVRHRHDPLFWADDSFYGHPYAHSSRFYGPGWQPGFGRMVYDSKKIEKWRVRIKNKQGVPYCYDLVFKSGLLRAIGIGDSCSSAYSPE